MTNSIETLLTSMAEAPLPDALDRLESDVLGRIVSTAIQPVVATSWRFAVVGVALVIGVGFGATSNVGVTNPSGGLAQFVSGADLAPSSLLVAS